MAQDFLDSKYDFNKKYKVYLEKSNLTVDGYKYSKPEYAPMTCDRKNFMLVFHFKKTNNSINPSLLVDSMEGDDFPEKVDIVIHFKKNKALLYACSIDGLDELIKEDKNDKSS